MRFKYIADFDDWEFYGDWGFDSFLKTLQEEEELTYNSDLDFDIHKYLEVLELPNISEVIYWWSDDNHDLGAGPLTYLGLAL